MLQLQCFKRSQGSRSKTAPQEDPELTTSHRQTESTAAHGRVSSEKTRDCLSDTYTSGELGRKPHFWCHDPHSGGNSEPELLPVVEGLHPTLCALSASFQGADISWKGTCDFCACHPDDISRSLGSLARGIYTCGLYIFIYFKSCCLKVWPLTSLNLGAE